jgi:eukaryotic-like serine/threonine-protein kinase
MSTAAIASGDRLGPYHVVSPLGAGAMGEVYRARDTRLGRDVALKVLPSRCSEDPDRVQRFRQEARAVAALSHSNVMAVHDVGEERGLAYAAFELLEGQTLAQLLEDGPLSAAKAVDYGVQICQGLAAVHAQGIVHRDLKPDNVFVTRSGQVKILDFGLAKQVAREAGAATDGRTLTAPGLLVGTVGYMAPEQARGLRADARSDIFSVGAILYEMVSGRRAFRGPTPADTLAALLTQDPPDITDMGRPVPPVLERVIRRCLERNPEERFQSAGDVAFGLEAVSQAPARRPPAPRSGSLAGPLALLALGAVALLAGSRRGPSPAPFPHAARDLEGARRVLA